MMIECSLPKLTFGNNYTLITDYEKSFGIANEILVKNPYLPSLDIKNGILLRIDFCYNYNVGKFVQAYISGLKKLNYPHRKPISYKGEGVQFKSQQVVTKFYDKYQESQDENAAGILRHETTIRDPQALERAFGKNRPILNDANSSIAREVLLKDLERLGIKDKIFANKKNCLNILSEKYGPDAGIYYFGLMKANGKLPKKTLAKETKIKTQTLNRRFQKIREAGLAPVPIKKPKSLPALQIKMSDGEGTV